LALDGGNISAINSAVLRSKLLQIASGAVYANDKYALLDEGRYELAATLVEEHLPKHSLVFFVWMHQRDMLAKQMLEKGISFGIIDGSVSINQRQRLVEDYQAGKINTLLLHPKTAAHGLTLTRGTRTIWVSPIYEADVLEQGIHRIYRTGQTEKTETLMIEAVNTCERKVFERREHKGENMDTFRNMLT
jgi:SNF2 family DNA or RNA helicase